ncbi:MAG: hypothetical protein KF685_03285 [Acidobacteria bacterium]|nr:hypothetical protein [Acidobacteriota bacterium]
MFYKPTFCCNCGEKIERANWSLWNSRRFCELCETEFKGHDMVIRVIVGFGLVMGVFGLSSYFGLGRTVEPQTPMPRPIAADTAQPLRLREPVVRDDAVRYSTDRDAPETQKNLTTGEGAELDDLLPRSDRSREDISGRQTQRAPEQAVYHCGARTKKGTPCSRRVKIRGSRCWQHQEAEW